VVVAAEEGAPAVVAEEGAVVAAAGVGRNRQAAKTTAPTVTSERKEFVEVDGSRS
jgi:hypothetical protein